jgi:predicted cupin superfamily sugar epimerase
MFSDAKTCIQTLQLQPHPEGGFYKETYRSELLVEVAGSAAGALLRRSVSTAIYFLLEQGNFSAFHKIGADEMWHFYAGQALEVLELFEGGELRCTRLGPDFSQAELPQHVVRANTWFASRVAAGGAYALVGCTVAPGFDFADFCLADRATLQAGFPLHSAVIASLTR